MSSDLLQRLCVRTSLSINGERVNHGSGFIIRDEDLYYVVTAHHCIFGERGEFQDVTPDDVIIEHQKDHYQSPFTRIEVERIVNSDAQDDWALLRIADPKLTVDDFSKIKLGIPTQKNIDVTFCGYQHVSPNRYRPFTAILHSLAPHQFTIKLTADSLQQIDEGAFIAQGLSGSGVGVEFKDTLYLIGLLKSVIGPDALNNDIDCCPVSCLSSSLNETIEKVPQILSNVIKLGKELRDEQYEIAQNWEANGKPKMREFDLSGRDLSELNLAGADLMNADLSHTFLAPSLKSVNLQEANLRTADLQGAFLWGCNLHNAYLRYADFRMAELIEGDLTEADLKEANLSRANLSRANLSGANLSEAELNGSKYDIQTTWPDGFDPKAAGAILVDDEGKPIEDSE